VIVEKTRQAVDAEKLVGVVKERYGRIAEGSLSGCCGSEPSPCCGGDGAVSVTLGYKSQDLKAVPEGADLGLGCGAPIEALALKPGETVLDLGSGGGLDAFLAAQVVGPKGRVIGVDMTPQMLERARANADRSGLSNVEFRQGRLESLPLEDASVDAVTSNCVINLVPDKQAVFREVARVLRPGGRVAISDIILDGSLPEAVRNDLLAYVGCVSGALLRETYFAKITGAGLEGVEIVSDRDFLATLGDSVPAEIETLLERSGASLEELRGKVRSVTFRAKKPDA
jgi:SAM-dependent methyltransferase